MFGQISEQFAGIIKNIRGLGKITDSNIKETVRKVRRTLIEADVNMKVVKSFISEIEKKVYSFDGRCYKYKAQSTSCQKN